MYARFSAIVPGPVLRAFRRELDYMDIDVSEKRFVGFLLVYCIALSAGLAANIHFFFGLHPALSFLGLFMLLFGGVYFWLSITAESKGKFVDRILPDVLQLVASNIRAGLTLERSLLMSAREEFGPLEDELKKVSKRMLSGDSAEEALAEIPKRIHSRSLERAVWLICKGLEAGGQMADLLTQLSDDLRAQLTIEDEIKANISIYVMMIFFAAIFGAPLLFGVSTFIAEVLAERLGEMPEIPAGGPGGVGGGMAGGVGAGAIGGFGTGGIQIEPAFIIFFAQIALAITTVFASLTIGVIGSGSEKAGLKVLPVLLIIVFVIFFVIRELLAGVFGQML